MATPNFPLPRCGLCPVGAGEIRFYPQTPNRFQALSRPPLTTTGNTPMIHYTNQRSLTAAQFADVLNRSGIHRPTADLPRLQTMLDEADILWTAWDGERLVGVARALTDYAYACYLSDLAVDVACQRQGIGKALVAHLRAQIGADVALILLAAANAMDYYPKIGFEALDNGFIIRRRPF